MKINQTIFAPAHYGCPKPCWKNEKLKFMKKIILLSFAFVFTFNLLQAQRGGRGGTLEERAEQRTERLTQDLSLSDAQAEKVKEVYLKYGKKFSEARQNADGDWSAVRETMTALRVEQNEELKKYLTAEQFEKYEKLEAERRAQRGERGRRGGERGKKPENGGKKS